MRSTFSLPELKASSMTLASATSSYYRDLGEMPDIYLANKSDPGEEEFGEYVKRKKAAHLVANPLVRRNLSSRVMKSLKISQRLRTHFTRTTFLEGAIHLICAGDVRFDDSGIVLVSTETDYEPDEFKGIMRTLRASFFEQKTVINRILYEIKKTKDYESMKNLFCALAKLDMQTACETLEKIKNPILRQKAACGILYKGIQEEDFQHIYNHREIFRDAIVAPDLLEMFKRYEFVARVICGNVVFDTALVQEFHEVYKDIPDNKWHHFNDIFKFAASDKRMYKNLVQFALLGLLPEFEGGATEVINYFANSFYVRPFRDKVLIDVILENKIKINPFQTRFTPHADIHEQPHFIRLLQLGVDVSQCAVYRESTRWELPTTVRVSNLELAKERLGSNTLPVLMIYLRNEALWHFDRNDVAEAIRNVLKNYSVPESGVDTENFKNLMIDDFRKILLDEQVYDSIRLIVLDCIRLVSKRKAALYVERVYKQSKSYYLKRELEKVYPELKG